MHIIEKNYKIILLLVLPLTSLFLHWNVFNKELIGVHVWRQTQTQATIQSFAEEDFNILNPRKNERGDGSGIFRMEFPLMQWLYASVVKGTGLDDVFVSRLMSFLSGLLTCMGMFLFMNALLKSKLAGLAAAWLLSFSPIFYYYTLNPLPDNFALMAIVFAFYFMQKYRNNEGRTDYIAANLFLMIAALVKLPFAVFYLLPAYIVFKGILPKSGKKFVGLAKMTMISAFSLIPVLLWYAWVVPQWEGNGIVGGIFHANPDDLRKIPEYIWFHFISTLPELYVNYAALPFFLLGILWFFKKRKYKTDTFLYYLTAFFGVLIYYAYEINMIKKVHDYYLFPFLPFVVMISVYGFNMLIGRKAQFFKIAAFVILLVLPVTASLRIQVRWNQNRGSVDEDLITYKTELMQAVPDTARVLVGNDYSHHIFLYYIQKKGWVFEQDWMGPKEIRDIIAQGCKYLYCNSRKIDTDPRMQRYFKSMIGTYGNIRVYELMLPDKADR